MKTNLPVETWHTEHMYFSRLLNLLQIELDRIHAGEAPNYALMLDILHYLRHFSDEIHHPREDVAFKRLASKRPNMTIELNRLLQEHRVIADAGERLLDRLNDAVEGNMVSRAEIESAGAMFIVYYRHHIAGEEREILPRAAEMLSDEDWQAVIASTPSRPDPLFGVSPLDHYRELRHRIALDG